MDALEQIAKTLDDEARAIGSIADGEESFEAGVLRKAAADNARMRSALEMIVGIRPCADNLLGNADIARIALGEGMTK